MSTQSQTPQTATPTSSILLVVCACAAFSCLDAGAKYLAQSGMSAPFLAWVRFAVHVVLVLILFRSWSNPNLFRVRNLPMQLLRGVFLAGSTIFSFRALGSLQLAEAVSIGFFSPMIITALAGPLLGEWAGWRRWVAILVGLMGVLVITRPGLGAMGTGYLYALASVTSYSIYVIMTRRMGASETAESMIFYSALAPVLFMAPAVPLYGSLPQGALQWAILLSLGFFGGFGHYLLILAYKQAAATALAPYPYSQMIWMVLLGYLIFSDIPDLWTLAGSAIIVASGLYIVNRERRLRLRAQAARALEAADRQKKP